MSISTTLDGVSQLGTWSFTLNGQPITVKPDGTVWALTGTSANVNVTNFPGTQPVSGTVTANQGGAPWTVKPDGTVWALTGTSANVDVTNTVTVSGTVTTTPPANASTNVAQFGGANVVTGTGVGGAGVPRVTVSSDSFPATQSVSGTISVGNFPATQPVSAASLPLPANAAQEMGGNLALLSKHTDLLVQLIAELRALRLQHASATGQTVDPTEVTLTDTVN